MTTKALAVLWALYRTRGAPHPVTKQAGRRCRAKSDHSLRRLPPGCSPAQGYPSKQIISGIDYCSFAARHIWPGGELALHVITRIVFPPDRGMFSHGCGVQCAWDDGDVRYPIRVLGPTRGLDGKAWRRCSRSSTRKESSGHTRCFLTISYCGRARAPVARILRLHAPT